MKVKDLVDLAGCYSAYDVGELEVPTIYEPNCEHDFRPYQGSYTSTYGLTKYQCRKCLAIRWSE